MNKQNAKLAGKITELAVNISEKHGIPVFADYSGHCDLISIQVGTKSDYNKKVAWDDVYRSHYTQETLTKKLTGMINTLKHLHKTGELPEGLPLNLNFGTDDGAVKLS